MSASAKRKRMARLTEGPQYTQARVRGKSNRWHKRNWQKLRGPTAEERPSASKSRVGSFEAKSPDANRHSALISLFARERMVDVDLLSVSVARPPVRILGGESSGIASNPTRANSLYSERPPTIRESPTRGHKSPSQLLEEVADLVMEGQISFNEFVEWVETLKEVMQPEGGIDESTSLGNAELSNLDATESDLVGRDAAVGVAAAKESKDLRPKCSNLQAADASECKEGKEDSRSGCIGQNIFEPIVVRQESFNFTIEHETNRIPEGWQECERQHGTKSVETIEVFRNVNETVSHMEVRLNKSVDNAEQANPQATTTLALAPDDIRLPTEAVNFKASNQHTSAKRTEQHGEMIRRYRGPQADDYLHTFKYGGRRERWPITAASHVEVATHTLTPERGSPDVVHTYSNLCVGRFSSSPEVQKCSCDSSEPAEHCCCSNWV